MGPVRIALLTIALLPALWMPGSGQSLYFPPLTGDDWETVSPASLGWCESEIPALYEALEDAGTKAFLVLKDGRIVLEKYTGTFTADSLWYWASAGKTLTAMLVGMAQERGFLSIDEPATDYLGAGWTSCPPGEEVLRTIRHQLTMTTGLDDGGADPYCTLPACLTCLADPGTRWAYHNGPYTLLDGVLEGATGQTLNQFHQQYLRSVTGITGLFVQLGYNNVFFSKARSMARFGLLMLARGQWDGVPVLADTAYFRDMTSPSQSLNPAYGYLTWLNGQSGYMVPGLQWVFSGSLMPDAPADMYMALGKNGQYINVVPGENLVLIRMGNSPDENEVPVVFNNEIWQLLNAIRCSPTSVAPTERSLLPQVRVSGPAERLQVQWPGVSFDVRVMTIDGRVLSAWQPAVDQVGVRLSPMTGILLVECRAEVDGVGYRQTVSYTSNGR